VERVYEVAVLLTDLGTEAVIRDLTVRDTRSDAAGMLARALQVQLGATMDAERVHAGRSREIGILASGEGTGVQLRDLTVVDTQSRECAMDTCMGFGAGIGIGAYAGAGIDVERLLISRNAAIGAQVARDGSLDLSNGEVSDHPIGANVQVPDYDLGRLSSRVRYVGNGRNLDSMELPVPSP